MVDTDIHREFEKQQKSGRWRSFYLDDVWDERNYALFGFLANVRNYSAVPVVSPPRGLPEDASLTVTKAFGSGEFHTASWLSLDELVSFDYGQTFIDRRNIAKGFNDNCSVPIAEGRRAIVRDILGPLFFHHLARMRAARIDRVIFWFEDIVA